ncbi:MAG: manganese efflux pump MntP [Christensenellales bacterium]
MNILSILLVGTGLSMDACAVAVSCGIAQKHIHVSQALKTAAFFGFFQGFMPLVGYYAGHLVYGYVSCATHWIAFLLLEIIGGRMIYSALMGKCEDDMADKNLTSTRTLLSLAIATSIDAFAVGVSFAMINVNIYFSVALIAMITFVLSYFCVMLGKKMGMLFQNKAEFVGGTMIMLIGVRILAEGLL